MAFLSDKAIVQLSCLPVVWDVIAKGNYQFTEMLDVMIKNKKKLLTSLIGGIALVFIVVVLLYPEIEWRYRMIKMLKKTPYVRLYAGKNEFVCKIQDKAIIMRIWQAMDLWERKKALPVGYSSQLGENPIVACIDYPTDIEFGEENFHFPIYLFADGRAQWGLTPDSRHWFWSIELKNEVKKLLDEFTTN